MNRGETVILDVSSRHVQLQLTPIVYQSTTQFANYCIQQH
jgi:hypothetical protein